MLDTSVDWYESFGMHKVENVSGIHGQQVSSKALTVRGTSASLGRDSLYKALEIGARLSKFSRSMASPQLLDEYDIIIAGGTSASSIIPCPDGDDHHYHTLKYSHAGGTAAGVIFGRLVAADPSLCILMLEMGPTTKDDLAHIQPARSLSHLKPDSKTVKQVVGKPSDYLNGRELTVQCGHCVGGGSSVGCECFRSDLNTPSSRSS